MNEEQDVIVIGDYPAKGFRQGVEEFRAAFATESEPDSKVADAEETPEVRVDRENLESASDVSF